MPPVCTSCGKDNAKTRLKLVSCLHSLCLTCLEQCVQDDGSIKCPTCAATTSHQGGCSILLTLPDSYPRGNGARAQTGVICDECFEDKTADSMCNDCGINLCQVHASGHAMSRRTRSHKLKSLAPGTQPESGATSAAQTLHNCALHPSQVLTHFCMPCNRLLCQCCMDKGTHEQTNHDVLLISDAAAKTQETAADNFNARMSGNRGILENAVERVKSAIQTLNDQTENASNQATDFFKDLQQELARREKTILKELDLLRASKLLLLENQLSVLQASISKDEAVNDAFDSCKNHVDFLRTWLWLNNAIDATVDVSKQKELCTTSAIVFNITDPTELLEAISTAGSVLDLAEGTLTCTGNPALSTNVSITIETNEQTRPLHLSQQQLEDVNLSITITEPDNNIVRSSSLQQSTAGHLDVKYRPRQVGQYVVAAAIADKHLRGSPVKFTIHPPAVFNVIQCHPGIQISNTSRTVRETERGVSFRSVCTTEIPEKQGTSQLRIRIDRTKRACMSICACSSSVPLLDDCTRYKAEVFGWWGHAADTDSNGGELGQPWQSGDVICLTLDHDKHTLTGLHERTGTTEVLENVTGQLYWYVTLVDENDQLTMEQ